MVLIGLNKVLYGCSNMKQNMTPFRKAVYKATRKIPKGKVATYGQIARFIGRPKAARAVGNALNSNPFSPKVPCHRVVNSDGKIGGFASGTAKKVALLRKEGLKVKDGKIVDFRGAIVKIR